MTSAGVILRGLVGALVLGALAGAGPAFANPVQAGCAGERAPCRIGSGSYHVLLPASPQPDGPAVVFLHGWAATGADMLRISTMVQAIQTRGYALILPDGQPRGDGPGQTWAFLPGEQSARDEIAFLNAVADDAAERFGLDRDRMLLAGYSIGGSMASYVACAAPGSFAAYAPVAGGFWRPHPQSCAGPVRLFHTHGWTDQTVPLEGRILREGFVQGDVFATLEIWRRTLECGTRYPDVGSVSERLWIRSWTDCAAGSDLLFALHPGGHAVPADWAGMALDWFERAGMPPPVSQP